MLTRIQKFWIPIQCSWACKLVQLLWKGIRRLLTEVGERDKDVCGHFGATFCEFITPKQKFKNIYLLCFVCQIFSTDFLFWKVMILFLFLSPFPFIPHSLHYNYYCYYWLNLYIVLLFLLLHTFVHCWTR